MKKNIIKGIFSSRGFFEYCFEDVDGFTREFATLAEAGREAKQQAHK